MTQVEQDAFLRENYAAKGAPWCAAQLGLTVRQVYRRQEALGLYRKRRWTECDDDQLRFLWGTYTIEAISKKLGRTQTTIYWRAQQLGLGLGCPRGCVYLTELGREAGFDAATLRRILAWADVPIKRALTRPGAQACGHRGVGKLTFFVDHAEGLEAVERWLAAEYVNAAAKARGLSNCTLRRWLVEDGRAAKPLKKKAWRVPTKLIDEVVARRRPS
ncbi:MAG TPA: hypothetical protein PK095_00020 [Myxococcota bacterium]|nr:hypothetical protein [Myxococcota bacterium]